MTAPASRTGSPDKHTLPIATVGLITLAIYGQEVVWNFYDAQVPVELRKYVTSAGLIGLVMGLDNVFGIFLQPWMGLMSDRRRARTGGRLRYVVFGAPIAALPFAFMPTAPSLLLLVLFIVLFAAVANAFKPVNESLLADYIRPGLRSRANGFIKLGTAATVATSAIISIFIVDDHVRLAFAIPPILMVAALWLAASRLRLHSPWEDSDGHARNLLLDPSVPRPTVRTLYRDLLSPAGRNRLLLVVGIFGFNGMWQALRSLFTVYGIEELDLSRGQAGGLALVGAAAFILAAVPISLLTRRFGRIGMIQRGLVLFIAGLTICAIAPYVVPTTIGLSVAAVGFACFAINAIVALWDLAPSPDLTGAYTGLFAVAYTAGAAAGPALLGLTVDLTSWRLMMPNAIALSLLVLAVFVTLTRRTAQQEES
jgi:MFS family permease